MLDEEGNVQTAHSTNVVPMIMIGTEGRDLVAEGKLADIAPTLLELLGLEKPESMSGTSMLK
jgi:2,3-bisphosphoglycerate-independent phosphoglycerate mutase